MAQITLSLIYSIIVTAKSHTADNRQEVRWLKEDKNPSLSANAYVHKAIQ